MPAKVLRLSDEIKVAAELKESVSVEAQLAEPPLPRIVSQETTSNEEVKGTPLKELPREEIIRLFDTKSDAIRALWAEGMSVNEIRKKMDFRYQHVRNVLQYRLKRKGRMQ